MMLGRLCRGASASVPSSWIKSYSSDDIFSLDASSRINVYVFCLDPKMMRAAKTIRRRRKYSDFDDNIERTEGKICTSN